MVVSTLKAVRKTTGKIRSNLHTGHEYAGSISPDHSQGQTLVEPLALPGVARHINKFLQKTTQKRGSGLAILHTSGLNCHWLKVVIALEVMIFLAFCDLSFCGRKTSLSGRVFSGPDLSKSVHNCCVPHQAPASVPGAQKSGHPASFHRWSGSKVEGRPMLVNDLLRMELMAECCGKQPAYYRRGHGAPAHQQFCRSGILCFRRFWHQFGGRLQYGAHQN